LGWGQVALGSRLRTQRKWIWRQNPRSMGLA